MFDTLITFSRILVGYIHESYKRYTLCSGFLFHFWTGSVFSITLLLIGFSAFEVLSYRWGIASVVLIIFGLFSGCDFRLKRKDFAVVFALSLLRAITSFSLIIAYQNIASGVASTIHFMYPLAVALVMMFVFREKRSVWVIVAVLMSLSGASVLSLGGADVKDGNVSIGLVSACVSVFHMLPIL